MRVHIGPLTNKISAKQLAKGLEALGISAVLNEDEQEQLTHALWEGGAGDKKEVLNLIRRANEHLNIQGKKPPITPEKIKEITQWYSCRTDRIVNIKIHPYDTWSMDHTLALVIIPMLKQLKATKHGSPGNLLPFQQTSNQLQACFDFYAEDDELADDAGHQQWSDMLDHMIWSFEQVAENFPEEESFWITTPKLDLNDYPEDHGKIAIPVRWQQKGELDQEKYDAYHTKIKEGLQLFGEYYSSLWY